MGWDIKMIDKKILDRLDIFLKTMEEISLLAKSAKDLESKQHKIISTKSEFLMFGFIPTENDEKRLKDFLVMQEQRKPKQFVDMLIDFMNERNMTTRDLCETAYVSTATLSKIMCNNKPPKRPYIMAFALALHLNENEYHNLLASASMSPDFGSVKENIVRFCLNEGQRNEMFFVIHPIVNELLEKYGQEQFDYKHRKRPVISEKCTGCGFCSKEYPKIFEMKDGKAVRKDSFTGNIKALSQAAEKCPAHAIEIK